METRNNPAPLQKKNETGLRVEIIRVIRNSAYMVDEDTVERLVNTITDMIPPGVALNVKPTYTAEQILEIIETRRQYKVNPGLFEIMAHVCNKYGFSAGDLRGKGRSQAIRTARNEFIQKAAKSGFTHKQIAAELHRERSTISGMLKKNE